MAKGIKITKKPYHEEPRLKKKGKSITTQSRLKRLTPIAAEVTIYVFLILLLSAGTYWRNRIWNSEVELWADSVKKSSNKARPHSNLGYAFERLDKYQEAVTQYTEALRINPDFAEAHSNLGIAYFMMGNRSRALKEYEILKTMNPGLANALYQIIK
jgi:protein O-mannosyl-transferase